MATIRNLESEAIWRDCRKILKEWAPEIHSRLPLGASDDAIATVEAAIGQPLTGVIADVYQIHDGLGLPAWIDGVSQGVPFIRICDALEEHRLMCDMLANTTFTHPNIHASPGVQPAFWLRGWLPIATFGNGDKLFLDFEPAPDGQIGQVVEWCHEKDSYPVRYASLGHYLKNLDIDWLSDLSAGLAEP